jgi:phosphoglycerate dehydrogenase-like enzyme
MAGTGRSPGGGAPVGPGDDRPAVLYLPVGPLDVAPAEELLAAAGVEVLHLADDRTDAPTDDQLQRVVALLVGYGSVGAALLDRLPALRLVATHSAGVDMVDVAEVRARGLWLANLPDGATEEVASHAFAMALALVRRLPRFDQEVREGRWDSDASLLPRVPGALTCGVVGLGRTGRAFARLAGGAFGRVVGFDPELPDEAWPSGITACADLDELLRVSDCVSLHVPLSGATHHLLDARRLSLLPRDALVVNVSRGELVDTAALAEAVTAGRLGGAACDVLEQEPPAEGDALLRCRDVLVSPHVAYLSAASLRRYAETPARNVLALLRDGRPLHPVIAPTGLPTGAPAGPPAGRTSPSPARCATTPRPP